MPKSSFRKTFTGCWTCRRRNVRCDKAAPCCSQCERLGLACEGYHIQLVWVDAETGTYCHLQRRGYATELTWKGYPHWTLKEIGHLISICDPEHQPCDCGPHNRDIANPFGVFPQRAQNSKTQRPSDHQEAQNSASSTDSQCGVENMPTVPSMPSDVKVDYCNLGGYVEERGELDEEEVDEASATIVDLSDALQIFETLSTTQQMFETEAQAPEETLPSQPILTASQRHMKQHPFASSTHLTPRLRKSFTIRSTYQEDQLFHHFLSHVSTLMLPIDAKNGRNPWKSAYPGIAVRDISSSRSLYYSILSQSAYHLSSVKGQNGGREEAVAIRCFGVALRELQQSLAEPTQDYDSIMGAILNIMLAEHVFRGKTQGWRFHLGAAMRLVTQHLGQRPWLFSQEAWIITQNFTLMYVISHTVTPPSASKKSDLENVFQVLCDVMTRPTFAYTMGATARHIKALFHAQLLEAQMVSEGIAIDGDGAAKERLREQANWIIRYLEETESSEVAAYMETAHAAFVPASCATTLITLHTHLFNAAVSVYVLSMILRYPPAAVVTQVWNVLSDAWAFIEVDPNGANACSISIWPVFVASADAYTPEAREVATRVWELLAETHGAVNRIDLKYLLRQIWTERDRLAAKRKCHLGEVRVDWREFMRQGDMEILLL